MGGVEPTRYSLGGTDTLAARPPRPGERMVALSKEGCLLEDGPLAPMQARCAARCWCLLLATIAAGRAQAALAAVDWPSGSSKSDHASRVQKLARRVVAYARHQVGVAYSWGGTSPRTGFDCSGLVYAAYRSIGWKIPRSSWDQLRAGRRSGLGGCDRATYSSPRGAATSSSWSRSASRSRPRERASASATCPSPSYGQSSQAPGGF
jgi:cell wall-associated NlpC family hydrolase